MMSELNLRFNPYGVYIDQTNVSNVIIPKDLRIALSQATTYDVLLQNQVKFQGKSMSTPLPISEPSLFPH